MPEHQQIPDFVTTSMFALIPSDALLIIDIQNDFLPGGALSIRGSDHILPVLQNYLQLFETRGLSIVLTRDWHPPHHCSFKPQGGPWPVHCVAGSPGSLPPPSFVSPASAIIIYKAFTQYQDAYKGWSLPYLITGFRRSTVPRGDTIGTASGIAANARDRTSL